MTRVAAVDCGTNSIRLLVADLGPDGLTDVVREMRIVRLGQGVDRTGVLAPEAIERTRVALREYAATIREHGAERVRMVATSATRDARNRDDFVGMVHEELGVEPDVVSGDEEARLSFGGAVGALTGQPAPVLLTDIGGGSTELVMQTADGLRARSMDVGSVRLTERHLHDDPPTRPQIEAVVTDVRAAIDDARRDVPVDDAATLVGVAGTVTTVAGLVLGLDRYDSNAIHGATLSADGIAGVTERLCAMDHDERAQFGVIHPGRVDVITAGALVLRTVVEAAGVDAVVVSEHDILDGIAMSLR